MVQWRYEELAETWQYCRNQSWGEGDQILVENLQPYTKYRVCKDEKRIRQNYTSRTISAIIEHENKDKLQTKLILLISFMLIFVILK